DYVSPVGRPRRGLYLSALPARVSLEGGMATHVAGFTTGALALGHHLDFISTRELRAPGQAGEAYLVPVSTLLSPTRAVFELWNNRHYSSARVSINGTPPAPRRWEFIYQRYNRFNCTGVLLSTLSGLPLVVEYNGSEALVGRNWDPIGMMAVLKRFERI